MKLSVTLYSLSLIYACKAILLNHGTWKICPLKACLLLLMPMWFLFFFVRREYMTDDCELNVTQ